jgi:hypothetical protein
MCYLIKFTGIIVFCFTVFAANMTLGQQFNSDNYLSKPHGVATIIITTGQRNSMIMTTFSLFPKWEFTTAAYIYNNDNDPKTDDGYSASLYAKYMIYENKAQTGGLAVKAGTGLDPGYLDGSDRVKDAFKTYWMNAPVTFPFFKNKLSWDLMPGVSVTRDFGEENNTAWAFTYSTRMAYFPFNPELSVVGEVFGSEGEVYARPEYKVGLRWEPNQYSVFALTFGDEFHGTNGAGFEIGVMLFTPPFCGIGMSDKDKKKSKM